MITVLAYVVLVSAVWTLVELPEKWGTERPFPTYGLAYLIGTLLSMAVIVPLCGRVLGWW